MLSLGVFSILFTATLANPITISTVKDGVADDYSGYRLPTTQIPSNYKLDLIVTEDDTFAKDTYTGTVEITFQVKEELEMIRLHAPMKIETVELKYGNESVEIEDFKALNETTSIRNITLGSKLILKRDYVLKIGFVGEINPKEMHGFYKGSYENDRNETEYVLATQFEPVAAREAFPCFDEPNLKATFVVSITYPKEYNVLHNTEQDGSPVPVGSDKMKVTFKKTPQMSTYLVAFIVSKFSCDANSYNGVKAQVCSSPETKGFRKLALENGNIILKGLDDFTGVSYKDMMSKMDQVALPDFSAGAMENWGIVTYRERLLLFDEEESSNTFKQTIVSVIAHEFTHQWFGDLVTCDWWDVTLLNEGFAAYFQNEILRQISTYAEWEMDKQFVVATQQPVMIDDAAVSAKALTAKSASPSEIHGKFDTITYNKGSSILKMLSNIMGAENFKEGLRNYLKNKMRSNAVLQDLIDSLEKLVPDANKPRRTSLSKLMNKWFNSAGYPVVTVTQNGNNITVKQKRFSYEKSDDKSIWFVPITYTIRGDQQNANVTPKAWLNNQEVVITDVFTAETQKDWIVVNNQQNAFYRVQYSSELWDKIAEQLNSDHTAFDVLTRAQLIDDMLNFARAGYQTKYSQAFEVLDYLKKETDYYPWVSAINSFNYLLTRVGENSRLGGALKAKFLELLSGVYETLSFERSDGISHIDSLKRELIFKAACRFGKEDCVTRSQRMYQSHMMNGTKVDRNLKSVVYCNGLKYTAASQESDWNSLWQKYRDTRLSTEQVTILAALGCTNDVELLKTYLWKSINEKSGIRLQDLTAVWTAVYTNSPEGIQAALGFLIDNHAAIKDYTTDAASLLSGIAAQISTKEQLDQLKAFVAKDDIDASYKNAGADAVALATSNLEWLERMRDDLTAYLASGSSRIVVQTSVIMAVISAFTFVLM